MCRSAGSCSPWVMCSSSVVRGNQNRDTLLTRRKMHWYLIIYKAILGMLPSYLCCLIKQKAVEKYFLRSQNYYTSLFLLSDLN